MGFGLAEDDALMRDDSFEWDDNKAANNLRKHGVSFVEASTVFADPAGIDEEDDDPDEERWKRIGLTQSGLLSVIYTERASRIRIISARKATRHEQDSYSR